MDSLLRKGGKMVKAAIVELRNRGRKKGKGVYFYGDHNVFRVRRVIHERTCMKSHQLKKKKKRNGEIDYTSLPPPPPGLEFHYIFSFRKGRTKTPITGTPPGLFSRNQNGIIHSFPKPRREKDQFKNGDGGGWRCCWGNFWTGFYV